MLSIAQEEGASQGLKPRTFAAIIAGTEVPAYQRLRSIVMAVDSEREMLREREESGFGERKPFDSSRQATYEDTIARRPAADRSWDDEDRE